MIDIKLPKCGLAKEMKDVIWYMTHLDELVASKKKIVETVYATWETMLFLAEENYIDCEPPGNRGLVYTLAELEEMFISYSKNELPTQLIILLTFINGKPKLLVYDGGNRCWGIVLITMKELFKERKKPSFQNVSDWPILLHINFTFQEMADKYFNNNRGKAQNTGEMINSVLNTTVKKLTNHISGSTFYNYGNVKTEYCCLQNKRKKFLGNLAYVMASEFVYVYGWKNQKLGPVSMRKLYREEKIHYGDPLFKKVLGNIQKLETDIVNIIDKKMANPIDEIEYKTLLQIRNRCNELKRISTYVILNQIREYFAQKKTAQSLAVADARGAYGSKKFEKYFGALRKHLNKIFI